ncbi:hypothetical protein J4410_02660 [Candidatus Woesearchaeota archaeon]|nr:hypothetical protein [Candidatus Woesearchaeota archaeon]
MLQDYTDINTARYSGLVRREYADSFVEDRIPRVCDSRASLGIGQRVGDFFVKKLRRDELTQMPPQRFLNNTKVWKSTQSFVVEPIGIIYEGGLPSLLRQEGAAYMITRYIDGDNAYLTWGFNRGEMWVDWKNQAGVLSTLGGHLSKLRKEGVFLLDIAPRDIVLVKNFPHLVDMEHVAFGQHNDPELTRQQIDQFRRDYGLFLEGEDLEALLKTVFEGGEDE